jgi:hypothetical protein
MLERPPQLLGQRPVTVAVAAARSKLATTPASA